MNKEKMYLCIDLKSFYASVECAERGLDPFRVNLAVTDVSRGPGAITLAITPHMKTLGIKNRCRVFEIPSNIDYIKAKPRMKLYMEYSVRIHQILLKYFASDDIYVYSIDESFIDVTPYLSFYQKKARDIALMVTEDIFLSTKITASTGIGTNLFLAKVALDIMAKRTKDNIGYLDEELFRKEMWDHEPLTDFWMIGKGTQKRLNKLGLYNLKDVVSADKNLLYRTFGINASYLIDHANGIDRATIREIKDHIPKTTSIANSQILFEDYSFDDAYLVLKEMVELNVLTLSERRVVTDHLSLTIRYSKDVIKAVNASCKITSTTNSFRILMAEFTLLYEKHVSRHHPIRQIGISFGNLKDEKYEFYDLFKDPDQARKDQKAQRALVAIKRKYGKNAIFKAMDLMPKATTIIRNQLIGGHNGE